MHYQGFLMFKGWVAIFVFIGVVFSATLTAEDVHEFRGKHFLASYTECDADAINNEEMLMQIMLDAVEKSGAQILNYSSHVFPGHGVTMVILLSESHASIHTYPEYGACFVDLFTCGNRCSHIPFDEALQKYLKPKKVTEQVLVRDEEIIKHASGL
jgi:S-adenosylmethionine decarboxylase